MGCCCMRDGRMHHDPHKDENMTVSSSVHPHMIEQGKELGIKLHIEHTDQKFLTIVQTTEQLDLESDWIPNSQEKNFDLKYIESSSFTSEVPVYKLHFNFGKVYSLKSILEAIQVPENRQQWDSGLSLYQKTESDNMIYLQLAGEEKIDLLLLSFVALYKNSVLLVNYSPQDNSPKPVEEGWTRGVIYFDILHIYEHHGAVQFKILSQSKIKDNCEERTLSWVKALKDHLDKV